MTINIAWLYPNLMSIYGDYGNVLTLKRRLEWRQIKAEILEINFDNTLELQKADIILMGGGQDRQQAICAKDMLDHKKTYLVETHKKGIPGLFACGGYQLMGYFYHPLKEDEIENFDPFQFNDQLLSYRFEPGKGADLPGLRIFPQYTIHYGHHKPRCIGNIVTKINSNLQNEIDKIYQPTTDNRQLTTTLVGFENHGGRTYFMKTPEHENMKTVNNVTMQQFPAKGWSASGGNNLTFPLGRIIKGYGNNGEDKTEGIVSNNFIGTYLHGFLIKNPHIADFLIAKALELKYSEVDLKPLDDRLEWQTHERFKKQTIKGHS